MKTITILGVRIACVDKAGLLNQAQAWVAGGEGEPAGDAPRLVSYVYANCLNIASEDPAYREALNAFDLVYADGVGVVWAARWLRRGGEGCRLQKLTGADWFGDFCRAAAAGGWRVYLLGGRPGVARRASDVLMERYPGLEIVGNWHGYLEGQEEQALLADIHAKRPAVVLVGMGAPRQEYWMLAHRDGLAAVDRVDLYL